MGLYFAPPRSKTTAGQKERTGIAVLPQHDPDCYLCPGGTRFGGVRNPNYTGVFVFDNDFPSMLPDTEPESPVSEGFFQLTYS
jgi:UDPglucose--hexose-1-phosphate uridylyltransferase